MKRRIPLLLLAVCLVGVVFTLLPDRRQSGFDLAGFGQIPVLANGRVKPFDSIARSSLLVLQGRQRATAPDGQNVRPVEWLLDVLFLPGKADEYKVFELVHPELLSLFGLRPEDGEGNKRFSIKQLRPHFDEFSKQARIASEVEAARRDSYQRAILKLHAALDLYQRLRFSILPPGTTDFLGELRAFEESIPAGVAAARAKQSGQPYDETKNKAIMDAASRYAFLAENASLLPIHPRSGEKSDSWRSVGAALQDSFTTGGIEPQVLAYAGLAQSWRTHNAVDFNEIIRLYSAEIESVQPQAAYKCRIECLFNRAQPFYTAMFLYVLAFLLAVSSWVSSPEALRKSAFQILCLAFALTSAGILARMWLESRPPVTNLYSSALFVGWVSVALCLALEALFKNAIASAAAGFGGLCTLIIAHHLSLAGDTMEMMRAVLDSNFWLATHVVTISIGYGATFLAGFLALIYVLRGLFTRSLDEITADSLNRMVYGIVCFATLFSVVGTVLGGIWADQSWGRFWGWDPKENGALIIVLWNAIILHARWSGLAGRRGIMCLAIFGNIVTAWSWFGTNMLGVGLHSYGFTDAAFIWLLVFVFSQLAIIGLAALPLSKWRSVLKT
jgi:ABC-type transport system involved in cytochrome c biogenesis permease subunit